MRIRTTELKLPSCDATVTGSADDLVPCEAVVPPRAQLDAPVVFKLGLYTDTLAADIAPEGRVARTISAPIVGKITYYTLDMTTGTPDVGIPSVVTYKLGRIAARTIPAIFDDPHEPEHLTKTSTPTAKLTIRTITTTATPTPTPFSRISFFFNDDDPEPVHAAATPPEPDAAIYDRKYTYVGTPVPGGRTDSDAVSGGVAVATMVGTLQHMHIGTRLVAGEFYVPVNTACTGPVIGP